VKATVEEDLRTTRGAIALVAGAEVAFALVDARVLGPVAMWLDVGHALVALVGCLLLWWRREWFSSVLCGWVFAVVALYFLPQTWWSEILGAQRGAVRDPLVPHQFLLLGVAILAPGRARYGAALLVVITASALGLWFFLTREYRIVGAAGEPWMTTAYAGVAAALLWTRSSRRALIRRLERERLRANTMLRMAQLFMLLRDRSNTPLQTLHLATGLLAQRFPEARELTRPMESALERLRQLSTTLASTEAWPGLPMVTDLNESLEEATRALYQALHEGLPEGEPAAAPLPRHHDGA
jgi:hypothetical protein